MALKNQANDTEKVAPAIPQIERLVRTLRHEAAALPPTSSTFACQVAIQSRSSSETDG